jgi:hypothetical protein
LQYFIKPLKLNGFESVRPQVNQYHPSAQQRLNTSGKLSASPMAVDKTKTQKNGSRSCRCLNTYG